VTDHHLVLPGGEDLLVVLPAELERKLRRARHLNRRAMRAPYHSNERRKKVAQMEACIDAAKGEAEALGIPGVDLMARVLGPNA
jgi:hypothetical protein